MLPTEDLFVYVYVLIDDLVRAGSIAVPARPGPRPACSDAELLAITVVRHLLGRRSEAGFLAEVARDWAHLFARAMLDALADISQRAVPGSALQHGGQRVWCAVPQADCDTATIAAARTPGRAGDLGGG